MGGDLQALGQSIARDHVRGNLGGDTRAENPGRMVV